MPEKRTVTLHYDNEATIEDTFRFAIESNDLTQREFYDIVNEVKLKFGSGIYYAAETYRIDGEGNLINFEPGKKFNPTDYDIGGIFTTVKDLEVVQYISELLTSKGFEIQSKLVNGQKSEFSSVQNSNKTLEQSLGL